MVEVGELNKMISNNVKIIHQTDCYIEYNSFFINSFTILICNIYFILYYYINIFKIFEINI